MSRTIAWLDQLARVGRFLSSLAAVVLVFSWATVSHAQTSTSRYDTPYYYTDYDASSNQVTFDFNSLDDAVQSAKSYLTTRYPTDYPANCVAQSVPPSDPQGPSYGEEAMVQYAPSTSPTIYCPSNVITIRLTFYNNDPGKNTGDAGDCNGGNGQAGGDVAIICPGTVMVTDPINFATGNKYQQDTDFDASPWLTFRRFYNSIGYVASSTLGPQWRHSFDRSLVLLNTLPDGTGTSYLKLYRPDGRSERFEPGSGGAWVADADVADTLTAQPDGSFLVFMAEPRQFEHYSAAGALQSITDESGQTTTLAYSGSRLQTVTDPTGRTLSFSYDGSGRLQTVSLPDGGALTYGYSNGNLASVQYPDMSTRQYVYNESALTAGSSLPNALTGVVDEKGVRYESTGYNSAGKAVSSSFAGGAGASSISGFTLTTPLGAALNIFTQDNGFGALQLTSSSNPCNDAYCKQPWEGRTYDTNGYPASFTDFDGNETDTTYNTAGLETQRIEAVGATDPSIPWQRTINTTWDNVLRNPLTRITLDANNNAVVQSAWVYNSRGQVTAQCDIDPAVSGAASYTCGSAANAPTGVRQWIRTYCDAVDATQCPLIGLPLSMDGPRTDVTDTIINTYYLDDSTSHRHGDLKSVTDAMGHATTYLNYDGAGRILSQQDANGVTTTFTYTPRGWLHTRTVAGATTTTTYTPYGAIAAVTDPDGVTITYGYDDAHRLTDITDAQGNHIHYTLDANGNRIGESTYAVNSITPSRSLTRTYNTLSQLTKVIDGLNQTVFDASSDGSGTAPAGYDPAGNLQYNTDALGVARFQEYDFLNRPYQTFNDYGGAGTTANTYSNYAYDALDHTTKVTDPSYFNTTYIYDGLSNATGQTSPDTGASSSTYDAAGNVLNHTDAKNIVSTSTYDALNRRTGTTYVDTTANVTYKYDEANAVTGCTNSSSMGRLTRVIEATVTTVYCYDPHGNVLQKSQLTAAHTDVTQYAYSSADRLQAMTSPDGTQTTYNYDTDGRVSSIAVHPSGASSTSNVVTGITWLPFGPVSQYTLGNGQTVTRTYDANYRVTDVTSPALALHFALDARGDITAIGNASGANPAIETYRYDSLYRLLGATEANGTALESYTYNATGDRVSKTSSGLATGSYLYTAGTHQLHSVGAVTRANDANGNTTGDVIGGNTYGFAYDSRNRLTLTQANNTTVAVYTTNALGQRIGKGPSPSQPLAERYVYDEASVLIGEYGTTNRDYVWLGSTPVAVIDNTTSGGVVTSVFNYVHADGLGTPRVVTNNGGTVIWQWAYQGNPFGEQQPTSSTGYVFNLRYPGQYFDAETMTNYNVYRTYEADTGRYLQSDPIGLDGGFSTYAYVGNAPFQNIDFLGLCKTCVGYAKYSGIGPKQALSSGALGIPPQPGSVALSPAAFGLPYGTIADRTASQAALVNAMGSVTIQATGLNMGQGGPSSSTFTIGDVGDKNVRNSGTVRFDIYRFNSNANANSFGKQTAYTTISGLPDSFSCPPGFQEVR
ncbi:RHS repeat-associated protein [Rhodanobacter sp. ANJX3]|uniref:RHS repeat-associated core domain-containing protein n=1 Tax=Rhodanobacter sp. ANJX3 TaxID=2723083 RepID=UPI00161B04AF|nr:RHS repeat-associated core domain-containing protein [Rhodanobacter sp. ANJX3]MBB5356836.1 RHS repeat-associated protein [Rhodanobacter sp. ANJX3]